MLCMHICIYIGTLDSTRIRGADLPDRRFLYNYSQPSAWVIPKECFIPKQRGFDRCELAELWSSEKIHVQVDCAIQTMFKGQLRR